MLLDKINTRQMSEPFVVPAPIGGLNGRDPAASMDPTDAYFMDNMFPGTSSVYARNGYEKHTDTLLVGAVQTLDVYAGADGDQLLAWAGDTIYDVSLATPTVLNTGLNSALSINAMFSNAADNAQHLISVTGFDTPKHYNGGVVANLIMTGIPNPEDLNFVFTFKGRLYFAAKDKIGFYYLPPGQIQGALEYFDLGQVSRRGGYLQAIASHSDDSGESLNDYIVFITSKGECIVYAGHDPSSIANFSIVGRYFAAAPIGPRCAIQYNSELVLLTLEGAIPFSVIRRSGDMTGGIVDSVRSALTSKLGKFLSELNIYSETPGWQGVHYSRGGWLLLNVPAAPSFTGRYYQYVMNTTTNAWCRFTKLNGLCWAVYNERLYFGTSTGWVMLADEGRTDDGADIFVDVKQAYNYFADERGGGPLQKHFQWSSLFVSAEGTPPVSGRFNVDFKEDQPEYVTILAPSEGGEWDVAEWDVGEWGFGEETQRVLITLNKGGFAGSLWLRCHLQGTGFQWYATQYVLERTKGLLI